LVDKHATIMTTEDKPAINVPQANLLGVDNVLPIRCRHVKNATTTGVKTIIQNGLTD